MASVLIRHADPTRDGAACAAIYAPFVTGSAVSFEEQAPEAEAMARRIELVSREYPWLVAEREGAVAGYAYASQHRTRPAYRWTADVTAYVDGEHRRQGVGRALYDALLGLLARQGYHSACAGITLPNPASVALHEACGFRPVGIYRDVGWKAGAWRDVGWWQCRLAPAGPERPQAPGPPVQLHSSSG